MPLPKIYEDTIAYMRKQTNIEGDKFQYITKEEELCAVNGELAHEIELFDRSYKFPNDLSYPVFWRVAETARQGAEKQAQAKSLSPADTYSAFLRNLDVALKKIFPDEKANKPKAPAQAKKNAWDAYEALAEREGINDLLLAHLQRLDPVISDAGCQWRVPFILDLYHDVQKLLINNGLDHSTVLGLITGYEEARQGLASLSNPKNVKLIDTPKTGYDSKYLSMIKMVSEFITGWKPDIYPPHKDDTKEKKFYNTLRYLTLCKALTANRVRKMDAYGLASVTDELDTPYSVMAYTSAKAELAEYSYFFMTSLGVCVLENAKVAVGGDSFPPAVKYNGPQPMEFALWKLLHYPQLVLKQKADIRIHSFYGPMRMYLAYQHLTKRPIIVDLKRLVCYDIEKIVEGEEEGSKTEEKQTVYKFNGSKVLFYAPDDSGTFKYVAAPTEEQKKDVCLCIEAYSMIREDQIPDHPKSEDGLYSPDFDTYIDTVASCDLVTLVMASASTHGIPGSAVFKEGGQKITGTTEEEAMKTVLSEGVSETIDIEIDVDFSFTSVCPLFGVTVETGNILKELKNALALMERRGLTNSAYRNAVGIHRDAPLRIAKTVPFAPIHMYASTYETKILHHEKLIQSGSTALVKQQAMTDDNTPLPI